MEIGMNLKANTSNSEAENCLAKANESLLDVENLKQEGKSEENLSGSIEVASKPQGPTWLKNWLVLPRQRKNGRIDKYYYHKETNLICRSLVEVDNYELFGILPKQRRKLKKDTANENPSPSEGTAGTGSLKRKRDSHMGLDDNYNCNKENQMCLSPNSSSKAKLKRKVEKFFKESYENMLNLFNDTTQESQAKITEEEKAKVEEFLQEAEKGKKALLMMKIALIVSQHLQN